MGSDFTRAHGPRFVDDQSEQTMATGEIADGLPLLGRHPERDELAQPTVAVRADDAQCGVLRLDKPAGCFDDAFEDAVDGEVGGQPDHDVEQQGHPLLVLDHLVDVVEQALHLLVELGPRQGEPRRHVGFPVLGVLGIQAPHLPVSARPCSLRS